MKWRQWLGISLVVMLVMTAVPVPVLAAEPDDAEILEEASDSYSEEPAADESIIDPVTD